MQRRKQTGAVPPAILLMSPILDNSLTDALTDTRLDAVIARFSRCMCCRHTMINLHDLSSCEVLTCYDGAH